MPLLLSRFLELQQISEDLSSASVSGWLPGQTDRLFAEIDALKVHWRPGFHCGVGQKRNLVTSQQIFYETNAFC